MNNIVFAEMKQGTWTRGDNETEQAFMERTIARVFSAPIGGRSIIINDMLKPEFTACSAQEKSLTLSLVVEDWMCNPNGTFHGGLMGTAADLTMGVLARFLHGDPAMSTVQLDVQYLRPVKLGERVDVSVRATKTGRRLIFLEAVGICASSGKPGFSANGIYM